MRKFKLLFVIILFLSLFLTINIKSNAESLNDILSLGYRLVSTSDNGKIFGEDLSTDVYVNTDVDLFIDNASFPEAIQGQPPTEVDKLFNFEFSYLGIEYTGIHIVRSYSSGLGDEIVNISFYNHYTSDLSDYIYYGITSELRTTPDGLFLPATSDFIDDSKLVFDVGTEYIVSSTNTYPNAFMLSSWYLKDLGVATYNLSIGQIDDPYIDINNNGASIKFALNYSNTYESILANNRTLPFLLENVNAISFKNESTEYTLNYYYNNVLHKLYADQTSDYIVLTDYTIIRLELVPNSGGSGNTDESKLQADLDSLILGGNIYGSFSPPLVGENGSTFTYVIESGAIDYVSYNSTVNEVIIKRPSLGQTSKKFILRVNGVNGTASAYREFEYTIMPEEAREYKVLPNWYYFNNLPDFLNLDSPYQKIFNFIYNGDIYNFISSRSTSNETNLPNTFALTYNYYDTELKAYKFSIDVATYTYNSTTNTFDNFIWLDNSYRQIYLGSTKSVKLAEYEWFEKNGLFEYIQELKNTEFSDLFYSLIDSQVYYIKSLLSWDLFGVNLFTAFASFIALALAIFLLKKIL